MFPKRCSVSSCLKATGGVSYSVVLREQKSVNRYNYICHTSSADSSHKALTFLTPVLCQENAMYQKHLCRVQVFDETFFFFFLKMNTLLGCVSKLSAVSNCFTGSKDVFQTSVLPRSAVSSEAKVCFKHFCRIQDTFHTLVPC